MTRVEARGKELHVTYTRKGKTHLWKGDNPLPESDGVVLKRGSLWTYALFGQKERYLRIVRKRHLRQTFGRGIENMGPLDDLPLATNPFYIEPLVRDAEGVVGVLQLGRMVYLASSWGVLRTPYPLTRKEERNGLIRLDRKALRSMSKKGAKALWEEALDKGLNEVLSAVLSYQEEVEG